MQYTFYRPGPFDAAFLFTLKKQIVCQKTLPVGLSFDLIQFTQEGPLGALVKKMADKDLDSFKTVFGENYQDLLDTLTKKGDFQTHQTYNPPILFLTLWNRNRSDR